MKPSNPYSRILALFAGLTLYVTGMAASHAQSTVLTFNVDMSTNIAKGTFNPPANGGSDVVNVRGTFNGWNNAQTPMSQVGSSTVYTATVTNTSDAGGATMKYVYNINGNSYETVADYNNRAARVPDSGTGNVVLPTVYYGDAGAAVSNNITFQVDMTQQIQTGNFDPNTSTIDVRGNFNGWSASTMTNDPAILRTNGLSVTHNVYVVMLPSVKSPNATMDFKFYLNGNAEGVSSTNGDSGGNRWYNNYPNTDQVLPVVYYGDQPYATVDKVTFSVDMTIVKATDTNFNPASVTINGDVMGWGGTALTNNPNAANTNIYSAVFSIGYGTPVNYQYRYKQISNGNTVYDHFDGANGGNNNRYYVTPSIPAATNAAIFNDAALDDYLSQPTAVLFSVDMSDAIASGKFNASSDALYINGQFANWYAWYGGANPAPAPAGYQMVEVGLTTVYTNTIIIPAGIPVAFNYKYGTDTNSNNGGPVDNEAGMSQNHYRVVRSTASGSYVMPLDKFGTQYGEPYLNKNNTGGANLQIGAPSAGKVPVSWLGRPGARLQYNTSLQGGNWQEIPATDGTNWTSGYASTNGLVSVTNWPVSGKTFFRVVKH